jgi:hypothetical protein
LAYLAASPTVCSLNVRRLRGIVDFEVIGPEPRQTSAFANVTYALPQWWKAEHIPVSPCSEIILQKIDRVASELWVERLGIDCALAKELGAGDDSEQCKRWRLMDEELKWRM